ncbi:MAG: hypothetical protein KAQ63_03060 [Candidatus Moranbacteria bacterium]|nr:hypothetical protein [Candidatus Moranbacteria bacterium]
MINKIKKIIKSVGFLMAILAVSFLGCLNVARADDKIDVEYPVGTNINGNKIFSEDNIMPGWETSETIRVENDSTTDDVNLFFTFDVNGDKKLAGQLKLYVIRVADSSYRIGGFGDRYDLNKADDEELYVDKLSATKGKEYRIKVKFDKDAGNEYQGLETKFDIEFLIEAEETDDRTEEQILTDEGRIVTGEEEPPVVEGEETTAKPEEVIIGGNDAQIAGMQDQCSSWPWWVWALILAGYLAVFYKLTFTKENKESEDIPWRWQVAMMVAMVIFWWYFDSCREYLWFLLGGVGGSGVEYGIFLKGRKPQSNNKP